MQGVGRFQAVRRLYQRGLVEVWSARPAGQDSGEPLAIKAIVFDPLVEREQFDAECEQFMEAARAQRGLTDRGARAWARVHEVSRGEDEAGFVLDQFRSSAQKLIASRAGFDDRLLRWLVGGVLAGVQELRRLAGGRAWGRLRSSNIFIAGERELGQAPIVLSDLKPSAQLSPRDHAEDTVQLGRLIYQLVMRRELGDRELLLSGVPDSVEWTRLGPSGSFWRQWCDRLLAASGESAAALFDQLGQELGVGVPSEAKPEAAAPPRSAPEPPAPRPGPQPPAKVEPPPSRVRNEPVAPAPAPRERAPAPPPPSEPARAPGPRPAPEVAVDRTAKGRGGKKLAIAGVIGLVVVGGGVAVVGMLGDGKKPHDTPPLTPKDSPRSDTPPVPPPVPLPVDPKIKRANDLRDLAAELPAGGAQDWWTDLVEKAKGSEDLLTELEKLRDALGRAKKEFAGLSADLRSTAGSRFADLMRKESAVIAQVIEARAREAIGFATAMDPGLAKRLDELEKLGRGLPECPARAWWTALVADARQSPTEPSVAAVEARRTGMDALAEAFRPVYAQWKEPAWSAAPAFADPASPTAEELASAAEAVKGWFTLVVRLDEDSQILRRALDEGRGLGEALRLSGGELDLLAALQGFAESAARAPGVEDALGRARGVLSEWRLIEGARASTDGGALSAQAADPQRPLAAALASWRRIDELEGWPRSAEDLKAERAAIDALRKRAGGLSVDRSDALNKELTAGGARRWQRAWDEAARGADPGTMAAIAAEGGGLASPEVVGAARFGVARLILDGAFASGGGEEAVRSAVAAFAQTVRPLALAPAVKAGVDPWITRLEDAAKPAPPLGPSWLQTGMAGADGTVRVSFRGVEFSFAPVAINSFVGTTEVSLGMANALLAQRAEAAGELRPLLRLSGTDRQFVQGMLTWDWATGGFNPRQESRLQDGRVIPAWVHPTLHLRLPQPTWVAPGLADQRVAPTFNTPIQYLTPEAAGFLAGLIGCRLPTVDEWKGALALEPGAAEGANLRDRTWEAQLAHYDGGVAATSTPMSFNGLFIPRDPPGGDAARNQLMSSRDVHPRNDGWLWPVEVGQAGGSRFIGLIGNVAEFATGAPVELSGVSAAEAVRGAAERGELFVVGGSALSPSGLSPEREYGVAARRGLALPSYSDVGFRLAFTSRPAENPADKVRAVLAEAPEVSVRAVP